MKSSTSRSLLPAASWVRIWLRRSTASGAPESASVWFWHTRQRSSCARAVTRFSTLASCPWARKGNRSASSRSLTTARKLLHEGHQLLLHHVGVQRADVLEADHALAVD